MTVAVNTERVLGWDWLRGLCAIGVACYHLLYWQNVAAFHAVGTYGVYIFFVLSGASLAYNYAQSFQDGRLSVGSFLLVRYMRLAPLYLMLTAIVMPWKILNKGLDSELLLNLLLNLTFVFGFFDPALRAVLIGGWSLGIEFAFYLAFPVLLWAALRPRLGWLVLAGLLALQIAWVHFSIGKPGGFDGNTGLYHQVPAFAAYFMGGCLLGLARRRGANDWPPAGLAMLFATGILTFILLNPETSGEQLVGWRGVVLTALCFVLVWLAAHLRLGIFQRLAANFGDATYGLYLIHPVLFFGLNWLVVPQLGYGSAETWSLGARLAVVVAVILVSYGLALMSERYVEQPLRRWSKRKASLMASKR